MSRTTRIIILTLMIIVVVVPIIPLVLWSFADLWPFTEVLPQFGTTAWESTLENKHIIKAFWNSALLVCIVIPLSLALSFFAAKALGTKRFPGRRVLQVLLLIPSFLPQISVVFGMQQVVAKTPFYNSVFGIIVVLLVFYVPYMTLLLSAVFETYDLDYERQALTLGVNRWNILWHVTIPQVREGIIVSCIFSFIGIWSAYLAVSVIAPPSFKTLSMVLFPMINSASNGYASTAAATILYIIPILAAVAVFSNALVGNQSLHTARGHVEGQPALQLNNKTSKR